MATIRRYVLQGITAIMGSYGLCAVKVAGRGRWTTGAQIGEQRFCHILCQREQAFSMRFTGTDEETPMDPVDLVQLEIGHFCRP